MITPTIDEGRLMGFEVSLPCPCCGLGSCHLSITRFLGVRNHPNEDIAKASTRITQKLMSIINGPCEKGPAHAAQ